MSSNCRNLKVETGGCSVKVRVTITVMVRVGAKVMVMVSFNSKHTHNPNHITNPSPIARPIASHDLNPNNNHITNPSPTDLALLVPLGINEVQRHVHLPSIAS